MAFHLERPTVLTPEIQQEIVQALADGCYLSVACTAAGITVSGFNHWRLRWEQGDPDAQKFSDFFVAVKMASGVAERNALARLKQGPQNWQSLAWFLERRFPQRWGRKDREPVKSPPPPDKPLEEMTDEELDRYHQQIKDARRNRSRA
jgi:transposase